MFGLLSYKNLLMQSDKTEEIKVYQVNYSNASRGNNKKHSNSNKSLMGSHNENTSDKFGHDCGGHTDGRDHGKNNIQC